MSRTTPLLVLLFVLFLLVLSMLQFEMDELLPLSEHMESLPGQKQQSERNKQQNGSHSDSSSMFAFLMRLVNFGRGQRNSNNTGGNPSLVKSAAAPVSGEESQQQLSSRARRRKERRRQKGAAAAKLEEETQLAFGPNEKCPPAFVGNGTWLEAKSIASQTIYPKRLDIDIDHPLNKTVYLDDIIPDADIPFSKISLLGVFDPNTTYRYIPKKCAITNRLSPDQDSYFCDTAHRAPTTEDNEPYKEIGNDGVLRCGTFPMEGDNCFSPSQGLFVYDSASSQDPSSFDSSREHCRWCKKSRDDYSFATYSNEGIYDPKKCDLVQANPKQIVASLASQSVILFIGSSHTRQIFRGLVADFRNERILVESHPNKQIKEEFDPFIRYEVSEDSDDLRDGFFSEYLDQRDANACVTTTTGKCVVFIFIWSETFNSQEMFIRNTMPKLAPFAVIISSVSAHEANPRLSESWRKAWEESTTFPSKLIFVSFPKTQDDAKRARQVQAWLKNSGKMNKILGHRTRLSSLNRSPQAPEHEAMVLHRECFHQNLFVSPKSQCVQHESNSLMPTGVRDMFKQILKERYPDSVPRPLVHFDVTLHSACQVYNQWPKPARGLNPRFFGLNSVSAYSPCEGAIDRGLARVILTVIIHGIT